MSFDLSVWYSPRPLTNTEAAERFSALHESANVACRVQTDERLGQFVAEVTSRYPQIDEVADDEIDACPWSVAFDISERHVTMPIMWARVEEIAPFVMKLAERHGLVCYDPQSRRVHLPPGLRGE